MTQLMASLKCLGKMTVRTLGLIGFTCFLGTSVALSNQIIIPKDLRLVTVIKSAKVTGIETFCESKEVCSIDALRKIVHLRFPLKSCANSLGPVSTYWSSTSEGATHATLYVSAVEYETEGARQVRCFREADAEILLESPSRNLEHVELKVLQ